MIEQEVTNDEISRSVIGAATAVAANNENAIRNNNKPAPKPCDPFHRVPTFVATGVVANARLTPLLPDHWEDIRSGRSALESKNVNAAACKAAGLQKIPDFLWENAPRHETKEIRDHVKVYSHLPNGIHILDSKWVLGRLFSQANETENDENNNHDPLLATCETHCFTGPDGFYDFARSVKLLAGSSCNGKETQQLQNDSNTILDRRKELSRLISNLPDIAQENSTITRIASADRPPIELMNWWVVKDAGANGAGGVWVVGSENAKSFGDSTLIEGHKYVAQQHVWPPVLYQGKKAHVRVYVTVTCDGTAFVHKRAFLHVANDPFTMDTKNSSVDGNGCSLENSTATATFDDQIHITNCCANSHDDTKFAGEILANFGETEYTTWRDENGNEQPVVPLADFFPSVQATVSQVAKRTFQRGLLDGGQKNNGFEYCGMDFMLSYKPTSNQLLPVAYLLEINSPPSQDTASSLPHAEDLHNEVLRDWMTCWVIPRVDPTVPILPGGWVDCHHHAMEKNEAAVPSKAAMLNKIRWALLERKLQKKESLLNNKRGNNSSSSSTDSNDNNTNDAEHAKGTQQRARDGIDDNDDDDFHNHNNDPSVTEISRFARSQFPFFSTPSCITHDENESSEHLKAQTPRQQQSPPIHKQPQIFFENAGGAQVPQAVIDQMTLSLTRRHREKIGSDTKLKARETLRRLLIGGDNKHTASSVVILGLNATSLLASLAQRYARLLKPCDEVVISTENHLANFDPWIQAAKLAGTKIKLWAPFCDHRSSYDDDSLQEYEISSDLNSLVTPQTRIVALPHASNVLGCVRPIADISKTIKDNSRGYAHIVVDGVAVAPHEFVGFDETSHYNFVDWYVVSMHKLFGPHIGVLLGRQNRCMDDLLAANVVSAACNNNNKTREERIQALLESGTANIEGCAGVVGLGMYFQSLSRLGKSQDTHHAEMVSVQEARLAYRRIRTVEATLVEVLLRGLARSSSVRVLDGRFVPNCGNGTTKDTFRLPTVSLVHKSISSDEIYKYCQERGIVCRNGFFLCTRYLACDLDFFSGNPHGALRISLAHYNTPEEVQMLCDTLERMPNWFGDE